MIDKKAIISLLVFSFAIASISAILNANFYNFYGPFYDSLGYHNQLAQVMWDTQTRGVWHALSNSINGSTVFLPWLMAAMLSFVMPPERFIGVLIQLPLIILQLFTAYRYCKVVLSAGDQRAVLFALALVTYPAVFHFNGGLPDFRMDLAQALGFGSFLLTFMTARHTRAYSDWFMTGIVAAIASLFRATVPVYIVLVVGVTFLWDLRSFVYEAIKRYLTAALPAAILAGWFYVVNFDHLYYYYFVWNTDANARLPCVESLRHLVFVKNHIGAPLLFALLFAGVASICCRFFHGKPSVHINGVACLGFLIPAAYLILSGAGLNPFVSMTAVPGAIVFLLQPIIGSAMIRSKFLNQLSLVVLAAGIAWSVALSIVNFSDNVSPWIPSQSAIYNLMDSIHDDAQQTGRDKVVIAFLYQGSLDGSVIINHLIFDRKIQPNREGRRQFHGIDYTVRHYGFGADAEWALIPGTADSEKLDYIVHSAGHDIDYVIMADEESSLPMHHRVNEYADYFRQKLDDDKRFVLLEKGVRVSATEIVSLFRIVRHVAINGSV